ncbi:MAG: EF-P lysine aminoacylase EpmA [Bdellovibrionota bacterium]
MSAGLPSKELLLLRHDFIKGVREFFVNSRDFIEVETPLLVRNPGLEPHLEYFKTEFRPSMSDSISETFYLPTSPEYHLKKALASGLPRIFEITRSFRNGELSRRHQPEFTMLEWYRHPGSYRDIARDVEDLCLYLSSKCSSEPDAWKNPRHFRVCEAFEEFCGLSLDLILRNGEQESLGRRAREAGLKDMPENASFDDAFNWIVISELETRFKEMGLVFLWDYPVEMAALSRRRRDRPHLAERFEFYFRGVELGNAFGELTDPAEQRRRCVADQAYRQRVYGEAPPLDEDFLHALGNLSEAGGIAVGLDRLLQCLIGASELSEVLGFPFRQKSDS